MKIIYHILTLIGALALFSACSIEDLEPVNELTEEVVITDASSANAVLNRVYTLHRSSGSRAQRTVDMTICQSLSGIDQRIRIPIMPEIDDFSNNQPKENSEILLEYYREKYLLINNANYLLEKLEAGAAPDLSEERSLEMQAEARTMRAMAHFHILRNWGQFYDLTSNLGVVVSLKPIRGSNPMARSTVADTYKAITDDLNFAIANYPDGAIRKRYYMSKTFAQATLAKVQLYMGEYADAAVNAKAVIDNAADNFELYTGPQNDIWTQRWENPEVLFTPYAAGRTNPDGTAETGKMEFALFPSTLLINLGDESTGASDGTYDPRLEPTLTPWGSVSGYGYDKYPAREADVTTFNVYYYMRMAEVYLIHAEAEIRKPGGNQTVALASLNAVRGRQSVPEKVWSDKATLLADIRNDKSMELFTENGEPWFDLIRYHILGDIDAFSLKASLNFKEQFIFPIPLSAFEGNPGLVKNPVVPAPAS